MNSCLKYIFALVCGLLFYGIGQAQFSSFENIEHINITTDRQLYLSGETVWFAAAYDVKSNSLKRLSTILYVDLFNNEKQLVKKQKFRIKDGYVNGKIDLPEQLVTGYYILRAYTRYQTNFPAWQLSSVVLNVVNPFHPIAVYRNQKASKISIGTSNSGNVIFSIDQPLADIVSKVNLLVNNKLGDTSVLFKKNGLGWSTYIPDSSNTLQLQIILSDGDTIQSETQYVEIQDIIFSVSNNSDEIEFDVTTKLFNNSSVDFTLLNLDNLNTTKETLRIRNGKGIGIVADKENFYGLNLLSFVTEDNKRILETFVTITPDNSLVAGNKSNYQTVGSEDSILVDLSKYSKATFPISVSMVLHGANMHHDCVLPVCFVKNPLTAKNLRTFNNRDNKSLLEQVEISAILMGKDLISEIRMSEAGSFVVPEVDGLTIQGMLYKQNGEKYSGEKVYCSVLGSSPQLHVASVTNNGSFVIPLNGYEGSKDIYLATDLPIQYVNRIEIESGYCFNPPMWNQVSFIPDTTMKELLTDMYINYQVNSVYDIEREVVEHRDVSDIPLFGGNLKEIQLSDFVQMSTTRELFNEIIPYVRVRNRDNNYSFIVLDNEFNIQYEEPLVLLDNIYFPDINQIMSFQPTEIKSVSVMNRSYAYGNSVFNGIISITTSAGNLDGIALPKSGVFFDYDSETSDMSSVEFSDIPNNLSKPNYANTVKWEIVNTMQSRNEIWINVPDNYGIFELTISDLVTSQVLERKEYIVH